MSITQVVDLDKLQRTFYTWQESMFDQLKENTFLSNELKSLHKQSTLHEQKTQNESINCIQLRTTVDKLHSVLAKRCNSDDENTKLKEQIKAMTASADTLEEQHKDQMAEALESMETVQKAQQQELNEMRANIKQQMQKDIEALQKTNQEKNVEIRQFQKQIADLERTKHTELVKLRLEYDAKLLKLQKLNSRAQNVQTSSANNEIFRRKLQHVKAESDREVAGLKRQITELEEQLQWQGQTRLSTIKKRRIS